MSRVFEKNSVSTDRWIKPFFKQYRKALLFALFLGVLTFICAAALMFTSGYLITRAAEMPLSIAAIFIPNILVRVFGVGKPLLQYVERLSSHDWILRMTSTLRLKLYNVMEKNAIFFRSKHKTGDILGLLAEDIEHLQNLYLRTIFPTIIAWVVGALLVVALGCFSLWIALVLLLVIATTTFLVPLISVLVNGARQTRRKKIKNELYGELTDNVLGVSDWIFAQRNEEYLERLKVSQDTLREIDSTLDRFARRRDFIVQVIFGIAALLVFVWAAGYFGGTHGGRANWIAAFVLGFFPLIDAFTPLSDAATELNIYRDSIERLNDLPQEGDDDTTFPDQAIEVPLTIEVKNLTFSYPATQRTVLNGLNLTINQGDHIAVLGRSGSGKSTLAALIRGDLRPAKGQVTLGGVPTMHLGDSIASYLGVIQQNTYLFNKTLLENLRIGKPNATEAEAWTALEKVGLSELVQRLPNGLNTLVDEAGLRFSGGERHRIALARILLQDVPILILDEPTIGLDPITEKALLETFFENAKDKTLIMITHHLQGVSAMDQVLFIENGVAKMQGTPCELEQNNEHYQKLLSFDRGIQ